MQESLLSQGFSLMLYGMGVVFVFLAVLVLVTTVMSALLTRYFPERVATAESARRVVPGPQPAAAVEPRVITVIEAAVAKHRARNRQ